MKFLKSTRTVVNITIVLVWMIVEFFLNDIYGHDPASGHWGGRWWNDEASLHFLNTLGHYHSKSASEHWFAISATCVEPPDHPCLITDDADKPGKSVVS